MVRQFSFAAKCFGAELALQAQVKMGARMLLELILPRECFGAHLTTEHAPGGMHLFMSYKGSFLCESLIAPTALVRFYARMNQQVRC